MGVIKEIDHLEDPYYKTVVGLLKDRSRKIAEIAEQSVYFFSDPKTYEPKGVKKHFKGDAKKILKALANELPSLETFNKEALEHLFRQLATDSQLSAGKLIHPTRLAVSGVSFGPGLFELLEALGKECVLRRVNAAIKWLESRKEQSGSMKDV
jgi:glutamyl-tRNA synthetase